MVFVKKGGWVGRHSLYFNKTVSKPELMQITMAMKT